MLTPVEAFRIFLCAAYPQAAGWADEVTSYKWFHFSGHRSLDRTQEDVAAAKAALASLRGAVQSLGVKLYSREAAFRRWTPIPDEDQRAGELDIFEGTFTHEECTIK